MYGLQRCLIINLEDLLVLAKESWKKANRLSPTPFNTIIKQLQVSQSWRQAILFHDD